MTTKTKKTTTETEKRVRWEHIAAKCKAEKQQALANWAATRLADQEAMFHRASGN